MKKILFIILTVTAVFLLQAETFAMKSPRAAVLSDELRPISSLTGPNKYIPIKTLSKTVSVTAKKQEETLPVYCPEANLTIVDSKQVKVKYGFWIVKVIKDLFSID